MYVLSTASIETDDAGDGGEGGASGAWGSGKRTSGIRGLTMITYTPAAKYHCRDCDELFIEPDWELWRGQKLSDNGYFYRIELCPSCKSKNIETAWSYRLRLAARAGKE